MISTFQAAIPKRQALPTTMKALVFKGPNQIAVEEVPIPRPGPRKLSIPLEPFAAGLGNHKIITTLCPGGKERMQRLMELVRHGRLDLQPLLTHTFPLDRITEVYKLFGERRDNVIKVAVKPTNRHSA